MAGKVVCIANRKGGVGKTTAAVLLAHSLQVQGRSVAVIDVDPQASATYALAGDDFVERIGDVMIERLIDHESGFSTPAGLELRMGSDHRVD